MQLVAMVMATWPLARWAAVRAPGDLGDPLLNAYLMGWGPHAVVHHPLQIFHATLFDPEQHSLALVENMLGLSLPMAPLFWVTGNSLLVANIALLVYPALAGLGAYLLIRHLTSSRSAALVCAVAYTVMPVRLAQVSHLHVSAVYVLPFLLLLLVRLTEDVDDRGVILRRVGALAVVTALGIWTSLTGAVFMGLVVMAWALWAVTCRPLPRRAMGRASAGLALGFVLSVPVLLPYFAVRADHPDFQHSEGVARELSAVPSSYLSPPPGGGMVSDLYSDLSERFGPGAGYSEKQLFPGLWLLAAAAAAVVVVVVVRRRRSLRVPLLGALIAVIGFVFSLGPRYGGREDGPLLPFAVFQAIGGLTRVPARMGAVVGLGLAVLAGWALAQAPPTWRRGVVAVSLAVLVIEVVPASLTTVTPPKLTGAHRALGHGDGVVLGLPTTEFDASTGALLPGSVPRDTSHLYLSTGHFRRIINGYGAYHPPHYWEVVQAVQDFPSENAFAVFKRRDVRVVIVQTALLPDTRWRDVVARLDAWPQVRLIAEDAGVRIYDVSVAAGTLPA